MKPQALQKTGTPLGLTEPATLPWPTPPTHLAPLSQAQKLSLLAEQTQFDRRFPPLRSREDDILIVSWAEIERQFVDLCAPWDRVNPAILIRVAHQTSAYESPEKTLRTLFVMNNIRTSIDSPPPRRFGGSNRTP